MGGLFARPVGGTIVGLTGSGKTALSQTLYDIDGVDPTRMTRPVGFAFETVMDSWVTWTVMSMQDGGTFGRMAPLIRAFTDGAALVVLTVDATAHDRFPDAAAGLRMLLTELLPTSGATLLVVATRADVAGAATVAEVRAALGLSAAGVDGEAAATAAPADAEAGGAADAALDAAFRAHGGAVMACDARSRDSVRPVSDFLKHHRYDVSRRARGGGV